MRTQQEKAIAFRALHETYRTALNTYASLYNGVCQRDWFQSRARGYESTLDAALDLDRLQARPEQSGGRPFEEPFEEPLELGEGAHDRFGSLTEGVSRTAAGSPPRRHAGESM